MSYASSKNCIRRIAAITCLFFCIGLMAVSLIHVLTPYLLKFWENNYQIVTAAIKYRVISLIIGTAISGLYHRFGHKGASSRGEGLAKTWGYTGL
jgi:fucose permease